MPERFEVQTTKRSMWPVLADYYETTIYDRQTGNVVRCAGNTPAESKTNAEMYLDVLNVLKGSHQEAKSETDHSTRVTAIID